MDFKHYADEPIEITVEDINAALSEIFGDRASGTKNMDKVQSGGLKIETEINKDRIYYLYDIIYSDYYGRELVPGSLAYDLTTCEFLIPYYKNYLTGVKFPLHETLSPFFINAIAYLKSKKVKFSLPKLTSFQYYLYLFTDTNGDEYRVANLIGKKIDTKARIPKVTNIANTIDIPALVKERLTSIYTSSCNFDKFSDEFQKDNDIIKGLDQDSLPIRTGKVNYKRDGEDMEQKLDGLCTGLDCIKLLKTCIENGNSSDSFSQCKSNFENLSEDQILEIRNSVAEMHPTIVLRILKSFGVKKCSDYSDEHQRTIIRIQSFNEWVSGLPKDIQNEICDNKNFCRFVNILISYMNAHPQILNTGFTKEDIEAYEQVLKESNYASRKFGIRERLQEPRKDQNTLLFLRTQEAIQNTPSVNVATAYPPIMRLVAPKSGAYFMNNMNNMNNMSQYGPSFGLGQFGGVAHSYHTLSIPKTENIGTAFVKAQFDEAISALRARGQTIENGVHEKMKNELKNMEEAEKKALKYVKMVDEYRKILAIDAKRDYVTEDKLEKLIRKGNYHSAKSTNSSKAILLAINDLTKQFLNSN